MDDMLRVLIRRIEDNNYEYKEIFKLKKMLEDANIPFKFVDREDDDLYFYRIIYGQNTKKSCECSVIQGYGTYGYRNDLLEIAGLLTEEEIEQDDVLGWVTAKEVFDRIQCHYNKKGEIWLK